MLAKYLKDGWIQLCLTVVVCSAVSLYLNFRNLPPNISNSATTPGLNSPVQITGPGFAPIVQNKTPGKWIVDIDGGPGSDTTSINEAIMNAKVGDFIAVRPGLYKEHLTLSKKVRVAGMKLNGKETVIESDMEHVIFVEGGEPTIEKLVLRQTVPFSDEGTNPDSNAIRVSGGTLYAYQIKAVSRDTAAIIVAGGTLHAEDAIVTGKHGIHLAWGKLTCLRCVATGSTKSGFLVAWETGDRQATFKSCKAYGNGNAGLFVHTSSVTVDDSDFYKNNTYGVFSEEEGMLSIAGSRIYKNNLSGIYLYNRGIADVEGTKIYENGEQGIYLWKQSTATVSNSEIYENANGIMQTEAGVLNVSFSNLYKNKEFGIVAGGSNVKIIGTKIMKQEKGAGFAMSEKGVGNVIDSVISQNLEGIVSSEKAHVHVKGSRLVDNLTDAYRTNSGGTFTAEASEPMPPGSLVPEKRVPAAVEEEKEMKRAILSDPWVLFLSTVLVLSAAACAFHFVDWTPAPMAVSPLPAPVARTGNYLQDDGRMRSGSPGKWIVDANRGADSDTSTIIQAVLNAEPGDTIYVKPGVYDEYFSIDKDLTIVGTGPGVILQNQRDHTLLMLGGNVTIHDIDIRQDLPESNPEGLKLFAIRMTGGTLQLSSLDVSAKSRQGIVIEGGTLVGSRVNVKGIDAVTVMDGELGCTECSFSGVGGVAIRTQGLFRSKVFLKKTRVQGSNIGLEAEGQAIIDLEDSDFSGNAKAFEIGNAAKVIKSRVTP